MVYELLILTAGVPGGEEMVHLIALVVAASILADVLVARWFRDEGARARATPVAGGKSAASRLGTGTIRDHRPAGSLQEAIDTTTPGGRLVFPRSPPFRSPNAT